MRGGLSNDLEAASPLSTGFPVKDCAEQPRSLLPPHLPTAPSWPHLLAPGPSSSLLFPSWSVVLPSSFQKHRPKPEWLWESGQVCIGEMTGAAPGLRLWTCV